MSRGHLESRIVWVRFRIHETRKRAVICSQRPEDLEQVGNLTPLVIDLDA